jgi:ubiquinone/menaquinone biosynthesis C-methylase UbiE
VTEHVRGRVLDAACGAGFWIKYYVANATAITLADHSENMLNESQRKVDALGAMRLATFIRGDLVDGPLPSGPFDAALIAFFLSHLTESQMDDYFAKLRTVLAPGAKTPDAGLRLFGTASSLRQGRAKDADFERWTTIRNLQAVLRAG